MSSTISDRRRIRHTPEQVFDVIADVRRYPTFWKPLTALRVLEDRVKEDGVGDMLTEARIRYKFVSERVVTRVVLNRPALCINVDLVEGPFHKLENAWRISPLTDGSSLVDFTIAFEFSNPILQMVLSANRERAIRYAADVFEAEAGRRHKLVGKADFDLASLKAPQAGA